MLRIFNIEYVQKMFDAIRNYSYPQLIVDNYVGKSDAKLVKIVLFTA